MSIEIIGMVGTQDVSESRGSAGGPAIDAGYLTRFARAHEAAGFDRVLIGYHATGPDGFAVAAHVLNATTRLKVLIAHRPGFVAPTLVARKLATLDALPGGGRVAIHHITGGDEADQQRDGDFADHDRRYARTAEFMDVLRRELTAPEPFDFDGAFYRVRGAFSDVKPLGSAGIPLYFGGASAAAVEVGAQHADVYMLWGEPVAQVAERVAEVRDLAARHGRTIRFSLSVRPIVAATEEAAWARAEQIRVATAERVAAGGAQVQGVLKPGRAAEAGPDLLGRVGPVAAAGRRGRRARRTPVVRRDPADRTRRQLLGPGRHAGPGSRGAPGLPPGGGGDRAHPRLRPPGRRRRRGHELVPLLRAQSAIPPGPGVTVADHV